jgi:hypothetical protein
MPHNARYHKININTPAGNYRATERKITDFALKFLNAMVKRF